MDTQPDRPAAFDEPITYNRNPTLLMLLSHKIRHHVFMVVGNRKMLYFGLSSSGSGDRNGRRIE